MYAEVIAISSIREGDSLALSKTRISIETSKHEGALELLRELKLLLLAISQARAYVKEDPRKVTISKYLVEF